MPSTGAGSTDKAAKVLNPGLYKALCSAFTDGVKIANQGMKYYGIVRTRPGERGNSRHDKKEIITRSGGEEYRVCCPYCNDKRFRLWINHRWGTEMAGMSLDHLAICYNENCQTHHGFFQWLRGVVEGNIGMAEPVRQESDVPNSDLEIKAVALPGVCVRLDELPEHHVAVRYMRERRGFDPDELGRYWGIRWCEYSTRLPPRNRLIIPIYDHVDGKLMIVNWQARWLDVQTLNDLPPKNEQKYFNMAGVSKSWLMYNAYRAVMNPQLVVICEGVFDVMRFGRTHAIGLFGKTASERQKELLWQHWGRDSIAVVALHMDAQREREDLRRWLSGWRKTIMIEYPEDKDAADLTTDQLWDMINKHL